MSLRFGSVCSGIEAASVAWEPLGWEAGFFSEIEPFPCSLLAQRYPDVPNYGDMNCYEEWPDEDIDVLVGGTPCQSFSIAGLRQGLDDARGNLMLTFGRVAARYRAPWIVWENVPGVLSSSGGADFASFLGLLSGREIPAQKWKNSGVIEGIDSAYGLAWRVLDAQYVRVESHTRAVPQRRKRVFVVGYLGDWRRAAAVLLEREGMSRHPAPRRESGKGFARGVEFGPSGGGFTDVNPTLDARCKDGPIRNQLAGAAFVRQPNDVTGTLAASGAGSSRPAGQANETDMLIVFDTTQITNKDNRSNPQAGDPCHPLQASAHPPAIAFNWQNGGGYGNAHEGLGISEEHTPPHSRSQVAAVAHNTAVRRLTPTECERLQGFKDGYTDIPHKGKPAADGPRYKALGNSMSTNCMEFIGEGIVLVEEIIREPHDAGKRNSKKGTAMKPEYAVGSPLPPSIGMCADLYSEIRELRLAMQKMVDDVKARENEIKEHIIQELPKSNNTGAAGKRYRAQIVTKEVPTLRDWSAFTDYVVRAGRFDLLHKRVADKPIKDLWEAGESVPGIEKFTAVEVSITKL